MDEYLNNFKKRRKNHTKISTTKYNFKPLITKFLLAVIFFLASLIFTNLNDKNLLLYKEYVLTESMPFTKVKGWYEQVFGKVLPNEDNSQMVFAGKLIYKDLKDYLDGEAFSVNANTLVNNITSGIVVYSGEKEGYGNTVIVQGVDGADIWYGNITNVSVNLYDYVETGCVLGEVKDSTLYLVIKKDNEYIKYEDYKS